MNKTRTLERRTIIDVGSGYGGTCRVLINTMPLNSRTAAIEIQESVHKTAQPMTSMAELASNVGRDSIDISDLLVKSLNFQTGCPHIQTVEL